MQKLLNTLFVTTDGAYLHRDGETIRVEVEKETKLRVPAHTLDSVVCIGNILMSPHLMGLCAERGVRISFLDMRGRFWARVEGPVSGNVLLRREQYRRSDEEAGSAEIARAIVIGKLHNCRVTLQRSLREAGAREQSEDDAPFGAPAPDEEPIRATRHAVKRLARMIETLREPTPLDTVRGIEGDAARLYFSVFDQMITHQKDDFYYRKRSKRPPLDNINALLSFAYTLLVHDVESALEGVGLDPAVGFLHRERPGRPSLALDLMEELRPFLADRLALTLINRREIKGSGFTQSESGAVKMDDKTRKAVLVAWQKRKQEEITHPFLQEKIVIGLIPHIQALLLARFLRGDLDGYPPFFAK